MTSRAEVAREFAGAMGFELDIDHTPESWGGEATYFFVNTKGENLGELPVPDAPLHEHLAFVGRIAEALGTDWSVMARWSPNPGPWTSAEQQGLVKFAIEKTMRIFEGNATDLSWAAMLAAIAAKGSR